MSITDVCTNDPIPCLPPISPANPHESDWPNEQNVDLDASTLTCHIAFWKPLAATDDFSKRLDAINNRLKSIHETYGLPFTQRLDSHNLVSVVSIPPWRHSIDVTLRFILHRELVSLTVYIHAGRAAQSSSEDGTVNQIIESLAQLHGMVEGNCSCTESNNIHRLLYEDVWRMFFNDNKTIPNPFKWSKFDIEIDDPKIIADYRGLILVHSSGTDANSTISALHPFLCCGTLKSLERFTVSTLINSNVLHISTLSKPENAAPFYMVCSNSISQISPKELGKVIEIGHTLIVLRFAALLQRSRFGQAAHFLHQIACEIESIRQSFGQKVPVEQIQKRIHNLTVGLLADCDKLFAGGTEYRLKRSKNYKGVFDREIKKLRISRLAPYKPYDEGTTEILSATLSSAGRLLSAYNNNIRKYTELQDMTLSEVTAASSEVTARENEEIADLQRFAEWALFILLGPYYGGMIITHILGVDEGEHLARRVIFAGCEVAGVVAGVVRSITKWAGRDEERYKKKKKAVLDTVTSAIKKCSQPGPAGLIIVAVAFGFWLYVFFH